MLDIDPYGDLERRRANQLKRVWLAVAKLCGIEMMSTLVECWHLARSFAAFALLAEGALLATPDRGPAWSTPT
jgi:hypothetical protein